MALLRVVLDGGGRGGSSSSVDRLVHNAQVCKRRKGTEGGREGTREREIGEGAPRTPPPKQNTTTQLPTHSTSHPPPKQALWSGVVPSHHHQAQAQKARASLPLDLRLPLPFPHSAEEAWGGNARLQRHWQAFWSLWGLARRFGEGEDATLALLRLTGRCCWWCV